MLMNDNEFKLQREVQELKAEVRRLRHMIEGTFIIAGLVVVVSFPRHMDLLVIIGALSVAYSILVYSRAGRKNGI